MKTSEQINDLAASLSKAQGAMAPAVKDAINPHYRSRYADLAANVEAARGLVFNPGTSKELDLLPCMPNDGNGRR